MIKFTTKIKNQIKNQITDWPVKVKDYLFADKLDQTITTINDLDLEDYIYDDKFANKALANDLINPVLHELGRLEAAHSHLQKLYYQLITLQTQCYHEEESNE